MEDLGHVGARNHVGRGEDEQIGRGGETSGLPQQRGGERRGLRVRVS
jgi:hypothetical protein